MIDPLEKKHVVEIEDKNENIDKNDSRVWNSCCLKTDKNAIVYLGQYTFTMAIFSFCAFQLVQADGDCDKSSAYVGLISFLMGKMLSSVITSH